MGAAKPEAFFSFAHSRKHMALAARFVLWPHLFTVIMSKPISGARRVTEFSRFSEIPTSQREECLRACREMTDSIYEGLDVEREIRAVAAQELGDTVLLWDDARLTALAVCHCGPGSEAGSDCCYIKFGAARSGAALELLFDACETLASAKRL